MRGLAIARTILFVVTALVVVVYYIPLGHFDYTNNWREGTYGFGVSTAAKVTDVTNPKLIADGIRPGDRVLVTLYTAQSSHTLFPWPGDRITLKFATPHGVKTETLRAYQAPFDIWTRLGGIIAIVPATVFLVVAFLLVYFRPGAMTWMFYLFAVGYFATKPSLAFWDSLPYPLYISLVAVLATLFSNFAALPLVQFVLRFPDDDVREGWRKRLDIAMWIYIAGSYALYAYNWVELTATGHDIAGLQDALNTYLPLSAFVISALILVKKFKLAAPEVRQRMTWLVAGLLLSFIAYAVFFIPAVPANLAVIIGYAAVLMPVSVAYAVFQYRVIDVNFVLNRAIVYGVLTLLVAALVSLLDWLVSRVLGGAHLQTSVEALITIGLGFALNRLHQTFESWVDRFLFWKRHRAEQYIRRVAAALPFATSDAAVTDGLVYEPVETLDLAGAALYRRSENSADFEFVAAWRASPMSGKFETNDNLVRFLKAEEKPVWLSELGTATDDRTGVFVLAVPILVRHQVIAFTLYASHRNGAQLDRDEVRMLEDLAVDAARAYDHVEAVRTREEMEEMRRKLERLDVSARARAAT
ncbi:MAG: GAF domain-containing protein [Candidatus Eremiobacteraeota bacterium]|nr:GAF domain-containing protein [Candidatus Eremiobacteraeota bacterium]